MVFGTGSKVGEALVSHPDVPVISFTGSTATAQRIRQACSQLLEETFPRGICIVCWLSSLPQIRSFPEVSVCIVKLYLSYSKRKRCGHDEVVIIFSVTI